jgi:hypothetical protein
MGPGMLKGVFMPVLGLQQMLLRGLTTVRTSNPRASSGGDAARVCFERWHETRFEVPRNGAER